MDFELLIFWFQNLPTWQKGVVVFLAVSILAVSVWVLTSKVIPHFRKRVRLKKDISWGKNSFRGQVKRNNLAIEKLYDHYIQTIKSTVVSQAADLQGGTPKLDKNFDPSKEGITLQDRYRSIVRSKRNNLPEGFKPIKGQNLVEAFEPEKIGPRFRIMTWLVEAKTEQMLKYLNEVSEAQVPNIREMAWFQHQEAYYEETAEGRVDQFYRFLWQTFSKGIVGLYWVFVVAPISLFKIVRNATLTPSNARLRQIHNRMRLFALVQERFIGQMREATIPLESGNKESRVRFRVRMRIEETRKAMEEAKLKELLMQFAETKKKIVGAIKYVARRQNTESLQFGEEPPVSENARHLDYAMLKPYFKQTLVELEEFEKKLRENLMASTKAQEEDLKNLFAKLLLLRPEGFKRRLQDLDLTLKAKREDRESLATERERIVQNATELSKERSHIIMQTFPHWARQIKEAQDNFYQIHERFQELEEEYEEFVAPKPLIQALELFREDLPHFWSTADEDGFLNALSDVRIKTDMLVRALQDYELWGEKLRGVQERVDQIEGVRRKLKEVYGEEVTQSKEWVTAWNNFVDKASRAFANADWERLREEISAVENPLRKHEFKIQSALERISTLATGKSDLVTEEDVTRGAGTRYARRRSSHRSSSESATTELGTQIPKEMKEAWEGTDKKREGAKGES